MIEASVGWVRGPLMHLEVCCLDFLGMLMDMFECC